MMPSRAGGAATAMRKVSRVTALASAMMLRACFSRGASWMAIS